MGQLLRRIILALATGYVLMYYSELMFWARFKPGDTLGELAGTWLFYSLAAYAFLSTLAVFRVHNLWGIFLAGALYGWLVEGVIVQTMYDAFPWQISWTGLAWHALLSVLVGWYWMLKALHSPRAAIAWISAAAIGLFIGFWAISWWVEEPVSVTSIPDFAVFTLVTTLLLGVGYGLIDRLSGRGFSPSRWELAALVLIFGLYFVFITIPAAPLAVFVLPPLLAVLFLALWRHRRAAVPLPPQEAPSSPIRPLSLLGLAAIPITAVSFYALAMTLGVRLPTNWVVYLCTTPLGAVMFLVSAGVLLLKKRTPLRTQDDIVSFTPPPV